MSTTVRPADLLAQMSAAAAARFPSAARWAAAGGLQKETLSRLRRNPSCDLRTAFFMGGLAVLLAGARGFERGRYLKLAEALHPGVSTPEVFGMWLKRSPVQPSRFLPMARRRKGIA